MRISSSLLVLFTKEIATSIYNNTFSISYENWKHSYRMYMQIEILDKEESKYKWNGETKDERHQLIVGWVKRQRGEY